MRWLPDDVLAAVAPDAFAGQWLDARGTWHIAYAAVVGRPSLAEIRKVLGLPDHAVLVEVATSLRELEQIEEEADRRAETWPERFYASFVDVQLNKVVLLMDPVNEATEHRAREAFGDKVVLVEDRVVAASSPESD